MLSHLLNCKSKGKGQFVGEVLLKDLNLINDGTKPSPIIESQIHMFSRLYNTGRYDLIDSLILVLAISFMLKIYIPISFFLAWHAYKKVHKPLKAYKCKSSEACINNCIWIDFELLFFFLYFQSKINFLYAYRSHDHKLITITACMESTFQTSVQVYVGLKLILIINQNWNIVFIKAVCYIKLYQTC